LKFKIRTAKKGDLEQILELYKHLHVNDLPVSGDHAKAIYKHITDSDNLHIFLLEEGGIMRASCYLNIIENLSRGCLPYGMIENVVTHEQYRRQGFAKAIVQHTLSFAWAENCYKVMLMTGQKELVPFYESCGFDAFEKSALVIRAPAL
jgi:predicted GNAT family N-acyltransferase